MSLSAERLAIANRAIQQTFEKASVAWQAIPHWETGDPGQALVRSDVVFAVAGAAAAPPVPQLAAGPLGAAALPLTPLTVQFQMTLAQVTAATPDALLAAVLPRAVNLAQQFDGAVLGAAGRPATPQRVRGTPGCAAVVAGGTYAVGSHPAGS